MNPTNDYVFRRLFGHVGNEEITKGLISSIINQEIINITLDETPITEKDLNDDKVGILDIKARLNNDMVCDIEMQVVNTHNLDKRIMFYWSKIYSSEIHKGQDYSLLHKTIAILIADFEMEELKSIPKFHTKWEIREKDYSDIILTNMLEIHIIELPKLVKYLEKNKESKKNKDVLWSIFILHPEKIGEDIMNKNEDIKKAKQELDKIKQDKKEQYLAELRMKYILDQKAVRLSGFEDGMKEGMKEGIKEGMKKGINEGIKEGMKKSQLKTAKKLLSINMPISQIAEITELTEDEINKII